MKQLDRIEAKLDTLVVTSTEMRKDVDQNTKDLSHHIKRTNLLETKLLKVYQGIYVLIGVGVATGAPSLINFILKVIL